MATLLTTVNNDVNGHLASFVWGPSVANRANKKKKNENKYNKTEQPQRQIEIRNGEQPKWSNDQNASWNW